MSNYTKKWVKDAIEREKTYTCKRLLSKDVNICKVERMLKNNCETCYFKMFKENIRPDIKIHGSGEFASIRFVTTIPTIPSWILGVK